MAILSIAAAASAAMAPSRALFSASFSRVPGGREEVVDGWGNTAPSGLLAVHHGADFGLLLTICAFGVLIAPALFAWRGRHPQPRLDLRLVTWAIGWPALLGGVVAALIEYEGGYGRQVTDLEAARGQGRASVEWGGCLWLSLAALGCAVIAATVLVRSEVARADRADRAIKQN